jgi:hypothetical protein
MKPGTGIRADYCVQDRLLIEEGKVYNGNTVPETSYNSHEGNNGHWLMDSASPCATRMSRFAQRSFMQVVALGLLRVGW